ncbi:MAG: hypothetical protein A2X59_05910 [Nitrospirae bacterium GWC2_42_7]|nr:MAG: hypothetical protein A2X59_05910 [Nitrospirae bacterium GWC2_42_7]
MKKKILAVDDESKILQLEKILFTKNGFDVVTASDGNEAVQTALSFNPDLILLDIEMPGKDGYATLAELRSHKELKDIPVIVLSGLRDETYHKISESMGSVEHIDKPFAPDKLLAKVNEILKG